MLDIQKAPKTGICYALYSDRPVVFEKYSSRENEIDDVNLLELHMFDGQKEFRAIKSDSVGFITYEIDDNSCPHDAVYKENVLTEMGTTVTVVNYIQYTEKDLLDIVNYRLMEV